MPLSHRLVPFIMALMVLVALPSTCAAGPLPIPFPYAETGPAIQIGAHTATLTGIAGVETYGCVGVSFLVGTAGDYPFFADATPHEICETLESVQAVLTGLRPGTQYQYSVQASNGYRSTGGEIKTFTTTYDLMFPLVVARG